jgi:hypothetical protein
MHIIVLLHKFSFLLLCNVVVNYYIYYYICLQTLTVFFYIQSDLILGIHILVVSCISGNNEISLHKCGSRNPEFSD